LCFFPAFHQNPDIIYIHCCEGSAERENPPEKRKEREREKVKKRRRKRRKQRR